jgi:cytoskeletal protein RodZ
MSVFGILVLLAAITGLFYWMVANRKGKPMLSQQQLFSLRSHSDDEDEHSWQQRELEEELHSLRAPNGNATNQKEKDLAFLQQGAQKSFAKRSMVLYVSLFFLAIALSVGSYYLGRYHQQRLATPTPESVPQMSESTSQASPQPSFRDAVNDAMSAAEQAQTAETPQQWSQVADLWEKAIAGMKSVPSSSDKHEIAQEKVKEYQKYLQYARQNAENSQATK